MVERVCTNWRWCWLFEVLIVYEVRGECVSERVVALRTDAAASRWPQYREAARARVEARRVVSRVWLDHLNLIEDLVRRTGPRDLPLTVIQQNNGKHIFEIAYK